MVRSFCLYISPTHPRFNMSPSEVWMKKDIPCGRIPGSRQGQHCQRPTARRSPGNHNKFQGLAPPSQRMQDRHLSLSQLVSSLQVGPGKTYEEPPHPLRMQVLDTTISRSSSEKDQIALASAENDSLGRPVQLLGLGRTGQNLTEYIERSEAPEDQVGCLASKVQEQDRLHVPKLVLCFFF